MICILSKNRFRYAPSLWLSILFSFMSNGLKSIVIKSCEPLALYETEQGLLLTYGIIKGYCGELIGESEKWMESKFIIQLSKA